VENGLINGKGIYKWKDGRVYEGNGKIVNEMEKENSQIHIQKMDMNMKETGKTISFMEKE
jgi:hypothetical protein